MALRATYLFAFERARNGLGDKENKPDRVSLLATAVASEPVSSCDPTQAVVALDDALQRNRDLVREVALLKEQLYASQSSARSLQDRIDALARHQTELSDEEKQRLAQLELVAMQSAYQNGGRQGELSEQRQEALRQISEIEGEMAGLFSNSSLHDAVDNKSPAAHEPNAVQPGPNPELAEVRRELAERMQLHMEINEENQRLRDQVLALERQLKERTDDHQQVLRTQQSLTEIVAVLQTLTHTAITLKRSLTEYGDVEISPLAGASLAGQTPTAGLQEPQPALNESAELAEAGVVQIAR